MLINRKNIFDTSHILNDGNEVTYADNFFTASKTNSAYLYLIK